MASFIPKNIQNYIYRRSPPDPAKLLQVIDLLNDRRVCETYRANYKGARRWLDYAVCHALGMRFPFGQGRIFAPKITSSLELIYSAVHDYLPMADHVEVQHIADGASATVGDWHLSAPGGPYMWPYAEAHHFDVKFAFLAAFLQAVEQNIRLPRAVAEPPVGAGS